MRREPTRAQRAARAALTAPIRFYKRHISPGLGHHCRFTPTCSEYAMEAIAVHGCAKGLLLAVWRILRCNPLGRWGYDPVPAPGRWRNPARRLNPPFGKRP
jgi:putative membrane protein insertion efficiency factor